MFLALTSLVFAFALNPARASAPLAAVPSVSGLKELDAENGLADVTFGMAPLSAPFADADTETSGDPLILDRGRHDPVLEDNISIRTARYAFHHARLFQVLLAINGNARAGSDLGRISFLGGGVVASGRKDSTRPADGAHEILAGLENKYGPGLRPDPAGDLVCWLGRSVRMLFDLRKVTASSLVIEGIPELTDPKLANPAANLWKLAGAGFCQQATDAAAVNDFPNIQPNAYRALQCDSGNWQAWQLYGNTQWSAGDHPAALTSYRSSLTLHPDNPALQQFVAENSPAAP